MGRGPDALGEVATQGLERRLMRGRQASQALRQRRQRLVHVVALGGLGQGLALGVREGEDGRGELTEEELKDAGDGVGAVLGRAVVELMLVALDLEDDVGDGGGAAGDALCEE
jgi:hypothetical protein